MRSIDRKKNRALLKKWNIFTKYQKIPFQKQNLYETVKNVKNNLLEVFNQKNKWF